MIRAADGGLSWELNEAGFRQATEALLRQGRRRWAAPVLIMAGYPRDTDILLARLRLLSDASPVAVRDAPRPAAAAAVPERTRRS